MTLPRAFLFAQSNLQDYVDCPRRFQLRHLMHLSWPSITIEPYLEYQYLLETGVRFHKIVRQHLIGIPIKEIERTIQGDQDLQAYWNSYIQAVDLGEFAQYFSGENQHFEEIAISIPLENFRLMAKYDVLIIEPEGKLVILDWKTSQIHPSRKWLANRLQTRIYPFILSHPFFGISPTGKIAPECIEMIYWFCNQPDQSEHFSYSFESFQADQQFLSSLVSTINNCSVHDFPLTSKMKTCNYCSYRSLCDRGVQPGYLEDFIKQQDFENSSEFVTLDYDQINEIAF